jgi:REP element-mobilizing transposase RayT
MSRTFTSLHYHIVFGTKNRTPSLDAVWRSRLHEYIGGTVGGLGGVSQGVGGVADHVHLLAGLTASHRLADFVRELKKASNEWIRDGMGVRHFGWQEGYAAFTVSATAREEVQHYIAHQEARHRQRDFRGELMDMLKLARIDFDAEYVG